LIHLVKTPNVFTLPFFGGAIIYTYTVTNPGTVALSDVKVTDNKCSPISGPSGDVNNNNMLDVSETWTYTCQTKLTETTTNTGMAQGTANGLTTIEFSSATVAVNTPKLPKTGLPPETKSFLSTGNTALPPSEQEKIDPLSPVRLKIPKINVDAAIESVGLTPDGAVGVSKSPSKAAWFNLGPRPGENGSSIIDGHFGWKNGIPAVFDNLYKLKKGDKIYVENKNGLITTFIVRDFLNYDPKAEALDVFSSSDGKAHLNLITCGGTWNTVEKTHSKRLVVFADKEIK
jgi:LPXTG-site transpeptidase (sortase) family protein